MKTNERLKVVENDLKNCIRQAMEADRPSAQRMYEEFLRQKENEKKVSRPLFVRLLALLLVLSLSACSGKIEIGYHGLTGVDNQTVTPSFRRVDTLERGR